MKRLLAIAVIWLGSTVAWLILGGTVHLRTDSLSDSLSDEAYALWGPPGRQAPPLASYQKTELTEETVIEQTTTGQSKKTVQHEVKVEVPVALDASDVHVKLAPGERRQYGISYRTRAPRASAT